MPQPFVQVFPNEATGFHPSCLSGLLRGFFAASVARCLMPQPVHAQMKRKHRSKSSRLKHAQRGTERGYTQVAHDAVMIAGMIEDLDDWQVENAMESRRLQKRSGQLAAQIHEQNCRGAVLADKEGKLEEQLAQASSQQPPHAIFSPLSAPFFHAAGARPHSESCISHIRHGAPRGFRCSEAQRVGPVRCSRASHRPRSAQAGRPHPAECRTNGAARLDS